jgi:hypothetical protein
MNVTWMKRMAPYLGIVLAIALLYDGYVFYSRWSEKQDNQRRQQEQEAALARKTLDLLGGDSLKISSFYVSPGVIKRGSTANICYGVTGAKTLRIDPPVEQVWPALTHCLQVSPIKDTEYKLTAEDAGGHSVSESFVLRVVK